MPEYLAPGVYIEETSFRSKSIEGVSTSTAGFVGPCRYGPTEGEPELLTSFAEFERIYGGLDQLDFGGTLTHNYLAHAVRAFFEEGGKRLYVARVNDGGVAAAYANAAPEPPPEDEEEDGEGGGEEEEEEEPEPEPEVEFDNFSLTARFVGAAGNFRVSFIGTAGANVLITDPVDSKVKLKQVKTYDTVLVINPLPEPDTAPASGTVVLYDISQDGDTTILTNAEGTHLRLINGVLESDAEGDYSPVDAADYDIRQVLVAVAIERPISRPKRPEIRYSSAQVLEGFRLNPDHPRSLTKYFIESPIGRLAQLTVPFSFESTDTTGAAIGADLLGEDAITAMGTRGSAASTRTATYTLTGGTDGDRPGATEYLGEVNATTEIKSGLRSFEDLEDISIVAAPGYSFEWTGADAEQTQGYLIAHCEQMRYRIAVLDSGSGYAISEVRSQRGKIDTTHAALYYPWVRILDPITEEELHLPPSGFVAGIYARNDIENGVHKAPANEVVRLAVGFELTLNKAQQDVLNPEGINCFRFFEGRGRRLWGARTASSDPEWKYVNLRRYFAYLERSIEKGTQWVVFEPNDDTLWARVRQTVSDFLFNEWKSNHLLGTKPEEAYFVRCDRSTMTQNDLDNGRLICLVGVSPIRPAEFVIFRIGQWTADANQ